MEVTINGKKEITSIKLAEEIVDPEDIETLQDAIVAAANEALRKADKKMPYRGPEYYQAGEYTYKCTVAGDFCWFQGYEEIYWGEEKVYECYFHGGVTK